MAVSERKKWWSASKRRRVSVGGGKKNRLNSQVSIPLGFRSRRTFVPAFGETCASLNIPYSDFYGEQSAKTAALFRPRRIKRPCLYFYAPRRGARRGTYTVVFSFAGQLLNTYTERTKHALLNGPLFARVHGYLSPPSERYRGRHFPLSISSEITLRCVA